MLFTLAWYARNSEICKSPHWTFWIEGLKHFLFLSSAKLQPPFNRHVCYPPKSCPGVTERNGNYASYDEEDHSWKRQIISGLNGWKSPHHFTSRAAESQSGFNPKSRSLGLQLRWATRKQAEGKEEGREDLRGERWVNWHAPRSHGKGFVPSPTILLVRQTDYDEYNHNTLGCTEDFRPWCCSIPQGWIQPKVWLVSSVE